MRRQTGHPDTEALANFRAGLVGGKNGRRIAAHIASCERCALVDDQLSAVTWALATIPAPSLPDAVERRIGDALAAEAAARQVASLAADSAAAAFLAAAPPAVRSGADGSEAEGAAAPHAGAGKAWTGGVAGADGGGAGRAAPAGADRAAAQRFRLRLSSARLLVPAAACLLLAGLGYLLSVPGAAGTPSSARTLGSPRSISPPTSSKPTASVAPHRDYISPTIAIGPMAGRPGGAVFLVTVSAIRYRKSTLGAQIRSQMAAPQATPSPAVTSVPGSQDVGQASSGRQESAGGRAGAANSALVPSTRLVGCVMHLTRDVQPALMQRATYQAEPAYVIAVPDRAWVVGLTCTATRPALITSVVLTHAG
jgi:hypothetical protein